MVTDANGCQGTANKDITVIDIRAGNKLDKVFICHKGSTIVIDGSSVQAHLNHGDMLASCSVIPTVTYKVPPQEIDNATSKLAISALPNPSANYFTIRISATNSSQKISMRVTDIVGRTIEQRDNLQTRSTIQIGNAFRPGTYIVEFVQGNERKMLKLVKMSN